MTAKKVKPVEPWWVKSTAEACDFFGVSARTLANWRNKGAPQLGFGKWDVKALVEWKFSSETSPEQRKLQAEANLKETKAELEQIKLEVAHGNYIETAKVTADLKRVFAAVKKTLLSMGHKVAAETNSLDPEFAVTANRVIDDTVKEALQQLSEGRFKR